MAPQLLSRFMKKPEGPAPPGLPVRPLPNRKGGLPPYVNTTESPFPMYIKYKGIFDFEGLYKFMALWLKKYRFEFHETLYKYKPPELEVRWQAERKKTLFAKDIVDVHIHTWGNHELEVVKNGKKKIMSDARMIIRLNLRVIVPFDNPYGERAWNLKIERMLRDIFMRFVFKNEFDLMFFDVFYYELYQFHTAIKEYLRLSTRGSAY